MTSQVTAPDMAPKVFAAQPGTGHDGEGRLVPQLPTMEAQGCWAAIYHNFTDTQETDDLTQ